MDSQLASSLINILPSLLDRSYIQVRWGGGTWEHICYLHAGMSEMLNMVLKILPAFQKNTKVALIADDTFYTTARNTLGAQ